MKSRFKIKYCFPLDCENKCYRYKNIPKQYSKPIPDLKETLFCENKFNKNQVIKLIGCILASSMKHKVSDKPIKRNIDFYFVIMEISEAMRKCFKNKIIVYPVNTVVGWKVEYVLKGKKYKFNKVLNGNKEKNNAITKSYIYLAEKYCQWNTEQTKDSLKNVISNLIEDYG